MSPSTRLLRRWLNFWASFNSKIFFQNPLPLLLKISRYLQDDLEFYRILINSNGSEQFLIKLKKLFVQHMETDTDIPDKVKRSPAFFIRAHFFAGGLVNLYQAWFRGDLDISLNEISLELSKIMTNRSASLIE